MNSRLAALLIALTLAGVIAATASSSPSGSRDLPQSLSIAYPYDFTSLLMTKDALCVGMSALVTEPLVFSGAYNKITPNLATSVSNPNPTTFVFHLRKGVHFSNGDPMTAEDVRWSIADAFKPGSGVASYLPNYKSVAITGPSTVTVHVSKPSPAAVGAISFAVFVQDKKYALAHPKDYGTAAALPIGTGPYKYTSFAPNTATLVRNDGYWGKKAPIQTVKFTTITNDNTVQLGMRSGSIQVQWQVGNARTIPQYLAIPGAHVYPTQSANSSFIALDVTTPPLNDIHVRKAIAYAVDRRGLLQALYHGYASILKSIFIPRGWQNTAPSPQAADEFVKSLPQYNFDLAKAKAELAKSHYPHGFTINLNFQGDAAWSLLPAESLKQNLKPLGVTVVLKPHPVGQLYGLLAPAHHHLGAWLGDFTTYPEDPLGGLAFFVGKANTGSYGLNTANYAPPRLEAAWRQVTSSTDNAVRWQGVKTILRAIATDVAYVPLFNMPQIMILNKGITLSGPVGYIDEVNGDWIYKLR